MTLLAAGRAAVLLGWRSSPLCTLTRVVLTLVTAAAAPAAAWFGKLLVDALTQGAGAQVVPYAVGGAGAAAAGVLAQQVSTYVKARHDAAITLRAESELFTKVCGFAGLRYFEDPAFQDRLVVAEGSATTGPNAVTEFAESAIRSTIATLSFLGMVAVVWPALAAVLVLAALPGLGAQVVLAHRQAAAAMTVASLQRRRFFYRMLLTDERAAKEVRLFGLGAHFRGRQLTALRRGQRVTVGLAARTAAVQSALGLFGALLAGGAVAVVALRVAHGGLSVGDVVLFTAAVAGVQAALSDVVVQTGQVVQSMKLFQGYLDVMRLPSDLTVGERPASPLRHGIRFEDVWFRYQPDGPWVLRGVSFEIPAGQSVGVVGVNGAGKSTLVKLLCRCYEPERGRIRWDGVDLRELAPDSLRARLAATFQDFMTYDLSARDNIGVGDIDELGNLGDPGAVEAAARRAGVHEVVTRLPRGYDTMLSRIFFDEHDEEPGVLLSGGQWQRIALARSLLREHADLLILDEPSSGLDAEAEHRVHRTLGEFRRGRTSLLISHRLGTLRDADRIVVLDGGAITEQGTHAELMATGGVYSRLFTLQGQGYQPVEVS